MILLFQAIKCLISWTNLIEDLLMDLPWDDGSFGNLQNQPKILWNHSIWRLLVWLVLVSKRFVWFDLVCFLLLTAVPSVILEISHSFLQMIAEGQKCKHQWEPKIHWYHLIFCVENSWHFKSLHMNTDLSAVVIIRWNWRLDHVP